MKTAGRLNAICPYFTMFPIEFPIEVLRDARPGQWVLDPFCGRGTTNYAARSLGLPSAGVDSSPVAAALTQAKISNASPESIVSTARAILGEAEKPSEIPEGEFWRWAFHEDVLPVLCRLREGLLKDCASDARIALRAILMGALHGPRPKSRPAYFSNQSPRTYAPKPKYAVNYWKRHGLTPEPIDVLSIISERAKRYYSNEGTDAVGRAVLGDSRRRDICEQAMGDDKADWVITSPPYYGLRTYVPDQWLRNWFLGGTPQVEYSVEGQVSHSSPEAFASQLKLVWKNAGMVCSPGARLVVRFGGISDRKADSLSILKSSLEGSGFDLRSIKPAGSASTGRRQALHFRRPKSEAQQEHDIQARWLG